MRGGAFIAGGLLLALGLVVLSPFASKNPDGLEKVTEQQDWLMRTAGGR